MQLNLTGITYQNNDSFYAPKYCIHKMLFHWYVFRLLFPLILMGCTLFLDKRAVKIFLIQQLWLGGLLWEEHAGNSHLAKVIFFPCFYDINLCSLFSRGGYFHFYMGYINPVLISCCQFTMLNMIKVGIPKNVWALFLWVVPQLSTK